MTSRYHIPPEKVARAIAMAKEHAKNIPPLLVSGEQPKYQGPKKCQAFYQFG